MKSFTEKVEKGQNLLEIVENEIIQNLSDEEVKFVFSTDIVCSSWIEWTVLNCDKTGFFAVPKDRFIAWDKFKSTYLKISSLEKKSISPILRKLYIRQLLKKNVESVKNGSPIFKVLISPEHSAQIDDVLGFTDWLSNMLPSLNLLHQLEKKSLLPKEEIDNDYEKLFQDYSEFLAENNLFEPEWVDKIALEEKVKTIKEKIIIFYPELLQDQEEYLPYLSQNKNIRIINIPNEENLPLQIKNPKVLHFTNSRSELRYLALKIREIVSQKKCSWDEIAVNVPDLENWRPYIKREFMLYCIPFIIRSAEPLSSGIGRIFKEIHTCLKEKFNYSSLRTLLLDEGLPWKDFRLAQNLVEIGQNAKIICNEVTADKDYWIDALTENPEAERELLFYRELKSSIKKLCLSKSFSILKSNWQNFENTFFDRKEFSNDDDKILGMCNNKLSEIIYIEKEFSISCESVYAFFLNELENSSYQPQQNFSGVSIFDYKTAAYAAFKYSIVINASQNSLTIPNLKLNFLSTAKKNLLGIKNSSSISDAYIRLYAGNKNNIFTSSENTFSGFEIPYNLLEQKELLEDEILENSFFKQDIPYKEDFITAVRTAMIKNDPESMPQELSVLQKESFENWKNCIHSNEKIQFSPAGIEKIKKSVHLVKKWTDDKSENIGQIHVTQSDLKDYFKCPRFWLYNRVFKIKETSGDAELLGYFDIGNICHSVIKQFMDWCKNNQKNLGRLPILSQEERLSFNDIDFEDEIKFLLTGKNDIEGFIDKAFDSYEMDFKNSSLAKDLLKCQKETFALYIMDFLKFLCKNENLGGASVLFAENSFYTDEKDFAYYGKIDCVLYKQEEGIFIIDYKNTPAAMPAVKNCLPETENEEKAFKDIKDFQIPLYVKLWNNSNRIEEFGHVKNAGFYSIAPTSTSRKREILNEKNAAVFEKMLNSLDEKFTSEFIKAVKNYDFKPDSSKVSIYKDCITCSYKEICRTTYLSGENL